MFSLSNISFKYKGYKWIFRMRYELYSWENRKVWVKSGGNQNYLKNKVIYSWRVFFFSSQLNLWYNSVLIVIWYLYYTSVQNVFIFLWIHFLLLHSVTFHYIHIIAFSKYYNTINKNVAGKAGEQSFVIIHL